jgi:L-lactate dehydrogenase complex protein LldF
MMRHWREREYAKKLSPPAYRGGLAAWGWVARRPALYHAFAELTSRALGWAGGRRGRFRTLPLAAGWTGVRDMPVPEGRSFHSLWAQQQKSRAAR